MRRPKNTTCNNDHLSCITRIELHLLLRGDRVVIERALLRDRNQRQRMRRFTRGRSRLLIHRIQRDLEHNGNEIV